MTVPPTASPTWADANNVTVVTQAASSSSPTTGGRYNWGTSSNTADRAVGFMTSSGYASPNSIMVQLQNNTGATVTNLAVAFDIKHYRINTATASVSFFYSFDGSAWTAATAGDVTLIASFVINGTAPQRVLVRGIGPTLAAFAVAGALPNPTLTLSRGATTVKTNDDWFRDPDAALINATAVKVGAFPLPAQSPDASMLLYLDPGAYTAQVTASGNTTGTGIALVEIYEVP